MRVVVSLCGTDRGRSGIGVYVREVLPRLAHAIAARGGELVTIGHAADLDAYPAVVGMRCGDILPSRLDAPARCAAWHLVRSGARAASLGADVLLLPAANRRVAAVSPVPTVAVVHDLAPLHVHAKYDRRRTAYARHVVPRALARATCLVTVSRATREDLAGALPAPRGDVRVVENGVDAARFAPMAPCDPRVGAARDAFGLTEPYLLYVARLEHPGKNHVRLVRAFAASGARHTHVLVLAGDDWGAAAAIDDEIARLGIVGRVRRVGRVDDALLPPLVAGADGTLMLGLREGFGLPALESLAAGRAVLASRTGALPEVLGGLGIVCDPLDERAIASGLDRLTLDSELRARAAALGPIHAARFTWERTATGLLDACTDACRGQRS